MPTGNRIWKQVTLPPLRLPTGRPAPRSPPPAARPTPTLPLPRAALVDIGVVTNTRRRLGLPGVMPAARACLGTCASRSRTRSTASSRGHSYLPYSCSTHTPHFLLQVRDLPRARLRHPGGRRRLLRPLPLLHHGDEESTHMIVQASRARRRRRHAHISCHRPPSSPRLSHAASLLPPPVPQPARAGRRARRRQEDLAALAPGHEGGHGVAHPPLQAVHRGRDAAARRDVHGVRGAEGRVRRVPRPTASPAYRCHIRALGFAHLGGLDFWRGGTCSPTSSRSSARRTSSSARSTGRARARAALGGRARAV